MVQIAEYVRNRNGEFYVDASRVSLRSIIVDWKHGRVPEQIAVDFPSVPLVAIYGAITYYLERHNALDAHFQEVDTEAAQVQAALEVAHPDFFTDMRARISEEVGM